MGLVKKTELPSNMEPNDLMNLFKRERALLDGHFVLSSGLHSAQYMQSALLLQSPTTAETMGNLLAAKFADVPVDAIVSPALGGLIIGHEVARAKRCRAIFTEKDDTGKPVLRRGFSLNAGERVLIIEDVITTGLSTREVMDVVEAAGAVVAGVGCIVNRSEGENIPGLGAPWASAAKELLRLQIQTWKPDECPLCRQGVPAVKPGSRKK